MGLSYQNYFYLGCQAVVFGVVLVACIITGCTGFGYYHKKGYPKKDCFYSALYWSFLCFWMGCPLFVWIAVGFTSLHWVGGWVLMSVIWISGFFLIVKTLPKYAGDKCKSKIGKFMACIGEGLRRVGYFQVACIIISFIIASFIATFFSYDLCVGIHPIRVSSAMSRKIQGVSCEEGKVCNFILTVPEDLSHSIIANFHSNDKPDQFDSRWPATFALYDTVSQKNSFHGRKRWLIEEFSNQYQNMANGTSFKMPNIKEEPRHVSWVDITGLSSSTTYYVVVGYQHQGSLIFHEEKKFRTAPSDGTPIRFISGGDMAVEDRGKALSALAAEQEPLFIMLGGDVAYDSGFQCCYRIWDDWFSVWEKYMVTPTGYSIPFLAAIGNHESSKWNSERKDVQFYLRYLPFQTGLQHIEPNQRDIYHSHKIGNDTLILSLDSDVVESIPGQANWIDTTLAQSPQRFKFAFYHIAIYPCTHTKMDEKITDSARKYWAPLFDRHNLTVAFENHYHLYKRTKLLKNQVEDPNGTLYIGDGAWGVDTILQLKDYDYLEKSGRQKHFLKVTLSSFTNHIEIESFGTDGNIFDKWNRDL
eukprot:gene1289-1628_t